MQRLYIFVLLCCSVAATAQEKQATAAQNPEKKTYVAPISCTPNVPTTVCKQASSTFSMLQMTKLFSQVEFVIADQDAFEKEKERLNTRHQNMLDAASKDNARFLALINRHPTAPSSLSDSVLFVLSDEGVRTVNRVVISTDLFREVKVNEKPTTDKDGTLHFPKGDFEFDQLDSWSRYIFGYVEGWNWGRMTQVAEESMQEAADQARRQQQK